MKNDINENKALSQTSVSSSYSDEEFKKAKELMLMFRDNFPGHLMMKETSKFAILLCDEVLKTLEGELLDLFSTARNCPINHKHTKYWIGVKNALIYLGGL